MQAPDQSVNSEGKSVCFLQTPLDYAMFAVAKDCFVSQINQSVGHEASLANINFETDLLDGCVLDIQINGFSQKLFEFAGLFIDNLMEFASRKFRDS